MESEEARLVGRQDLARTVDTIGVVLTGAPIGSVVGLNRRNGLANARGELIAIDTVRSQKGCGPGPAVPAPR